MPVARVPATMAVTTPVGDLRPAGVAGDVLQQSPGPDREPQGNGRERTVWNGVFRLLIRRAGNTRRTFVGRRVNTPAGRTIRAQRLARHLDVIVAARIRAERLAAVAKLFVQAAALAGTAWSICVTPWWSWVSIAGAGFLCSSLLATWIDLRAEAHWFRLGQRIANGDEPER